MDQKILIVDDTKVNVDILVQALKDKYKLAVVMSGIKALEYANKNKIDLILLDVMMPEMDGFEVCHILKTQPHTQDIPVIFITAMDAIRHKTKGFEVGAVDYITKPFDVAEIHSRVKTHLHLKIAQERQKNQNIILEKMVAERTKELEQTQIEIIERLGLAAEYRDKETGNHIQRMSKFCELLGKTIGLSDKECKILGLASRMHDVGKIGISDNILLKPAKLTPEEREIMKRHSIIGANLLSKSNSELLQQAEIIARTHHEKWDGTGYCEGLKGEQIPLMGRIVCICDVFDALISRRSYKDPWPVELAFNEIKAGSGTFFDPTLVSEFIQLEPMIRDIIENFKE
ncbi:MAG: two-component system response regulator [Desulfobacterales bacterium]|nr:two-component system response regulator [Desulfobacterales bacterium]